MFNRFTIALVGAAAVAMLPTAASATGYIQYTMTGTVSGTKTTQSLSGPGATESVSGRATFTYVLPATGSTANALHYFNGGSSSFGASSFAETGFDGLGRRGEVSATACTGGSSGTGCNVSRILEAWRTGSYDLNGTIDSFTSTVLTSAPASLGFSYYLLDLAPIATSSVSVTRLQSTVAAVPEPATWMSMIAGFALLGVAFRRRPAQRKAAVAA